MQSWGVSHHLSSFYGDFVPMDVVVDSTVIHDMNIVVENRVILVITQNILHFSDVQPVCNEPDIFLIRYLIGEYSGLCNVG